MKYEVESEVGKRGILCGMLLGDGGKKDLSSFYMGHSKKQLDYILFKKMLLEQITGEYVYFGESTQFNWQYGRAYESCRIYPKPNLLISKLVNTLYQTGCKEVTWEFLSWLTLEGVAIWYMDDGSCSHKGPYSLEITLNTYIPLDENNLIIEYFEFYWGIEWQLNNSRLRMGTREGRKLFELLESYVIPSMAYKLDKLPAGELHGTPALAG